MGYRLLSPGESCEDHESGNNIPAIVGGCAAGAVVLLWLGHKHKQNQRAAAAVAAQAPAPAPAPARDSPVPSVSRRSSSTTLGETDAETGGGPLEGLPGYADNPPAYEFRMNYPKPPTPPPTQQRTVAPIWTTVSSVPPSRLPPVGVTQPPLQPEDYDEPPPSYSSLGFH